MERHLEFGVNRAKNWAYSQGRKAAGIGVRQLLGGLAGIVATTIGAAGIATFAPAVMSLGAGAFIAHWLGRSEHTHREEAMTDLYRREVAKLSGKEPENVTVKDFEHIARKNPTLQEAIDRSEKRINADTAGWFFTALLAATATVGVGILLTTTFGAAAPGLLLGKIVFGGMASMATIATTRGKIKEIVDKSYEVDQPTAYDRIQSLEMKQATGKILSRRIQREDIFDVYVSANPELAREIEGRYGSSYASLPDNKRHEVMLSYDKRLGLSAVLEAIHANEFNAQELAFRVHGQESGVSPDPTLTQHITNGVSHAKERIGHLRQKSQEAYQSLVGRFRKQEESQEIEAEMQQPEVESELPQGRHAERLEKNGYQRPTGEGKYADRHRQPASRENWVASTQGAGVKSGMDLVPT